MCPYKYDVVFTNHNVETLYAFSVEEAKILAKAKQIRMGNSYNIEFVREYLSNGKENIYK